MAGGGDGIMNGRRSIYGDTWTGNYLPKKQNRSGQHGGGTTRAPLSTTGTPPTLGCGSMPPTWQPPSVEPERRRWHCGRQVVHSPGGRLAAYDTSADKQALVMYRSLSGQA